MIFIPQESRGSPQASLVLLLIPTTSTSNGYSFPWHNNLSFDGTPLEDLNLHLLAFLEVCDTVKLIRDGVSNDPIRLRLFPFSLRDKARAWLYCSTPGWITTWDELTRALLTKFFPPSKTASLSNHITNFLQKDDEMFYKAWERFKDLLHLCPRHGLQ